MRQRRHSASAAPGRLGELERRLLQEPGVIAVSFADGAPGGRISRARR